jgi:hypothetical protein
MTAWVFAVAVGSSGLEITCDLQAWLARSWFGWEQEFDERAQVRKAEFAFVEEVRQIATQRLLLRAGNGRSREEAYGCGFGFASPPYAMQHLPSAYTRHHQVEKDCIKGIVIVQYLYGLLTILRHGNRGTTSLCDDLHYGANMFVIVYHKQALLQYHDIYSLVVFVS